MCVYIYAVPEQYLLVAMRDSVCRVSLDTQDHTDDLVTTLNDLDNVIAIYALCVYISMQCRSSICW